MMYARAWRVDLPGALREGRAARAGPTVEVGLE
jgi:hypothetical protein